MTHTQTQGADGAGSYVDWDNLNRLFAQMPSGPWVVSRDTAGHEIRQIDTDPTNKHHWPFHLCRSIPGQRAACDDAVFDLIAGVLNAWPQISAERSEEAEIERILAMPEDDLRKRFLANGESPEQAATISRLCFDAASLRVALTRISEQYVTHRGDMTDAEALRAIKSIADAALAAKASTPAPAATPGVPDSLRALLERLAKASQSLAEFPPNGLVRGDLYVAAKNEGQGTGWRYVCSGASVSDLDAAASLIAAQPAGQAGDAGAGWLPIETAPRDGSKFDAWAVDPSTGSMGVRFADVQMRGDGSGFGVVIHQGDAHWEYLERQGPTFPTWKLTHWRLAPAGPGKPAPNSTRTGAAETEVVRIFKDGDAWCCLLGENLQDGISGFGDTPDGALKAFHRKLSGDLVPALRAALKTADETLRGVIHDHTTLDWLLDQEEEGHGPLATIKAALAARPEVPSDAGWSRPEGNNADEWHAWLEEHRSTGSAYLAVQIAEALDAALAAGSKEARDA